MTDASARGPPAAGIDPHLEGRVTAKTLENYKRAAALLVSWCQLHHANPWTPDEWDDTLIEYKNSRRADMGKAEFIQTVSAVEFRFPRLKGRLACAHAAIRGWEIITPVKHTV